MLPAATNYFRSLTAIEKKALCANCGITRQYLYNLISRPERKVSLELACKLEKATNGRVTRRSLLPQVDWDFVESLAK